MEHVCRQVERHLHSILSLIGDVKDIGYAVLYSNQKIPTTEFNHAFKVNVPEFEADKLVGDVVRYYESIGAKPCFRISPTTRPQNLANYLRRQGFKLALEEDVMTYGVEDKSFKADSNVNVVTTDGNLTDVWNEIFIKSFEVPAVMRDAFSDMHKKVIQHKEIKPYLGYFQGKPAGACALLSFNSVGGIFNVGTVQEHRGKGVATALLHAVISDSLSIGNDLLYLITTKGSNAERLYASLGFRLDHTLSRYER